MEGQQAKRNQRAEPVERKNQALGTIKREMVEDGNTTRRAQRVDKSRHPRVKQEVRDEEGPVKKELPVTRRSSAAKVTAVVTIAAIYYLRFLVCRTLANHSDTQALHSPRNHR